MYSINWLFFVCLPVAPQDEKEVEGKIWIEFDDGDSGFFQLNEIKRIHPDFPVEGTATPLHLVRGFSIFFSSTDRHSSSVISEPINLTGRVSELPLFQNEPRCLSFKGKYISLTHKFTTFSYENLCTRSRFNKKSSGNLNRVHRMVYR